MADKPKFGASYFLCLGVGGVCTILGLLAVGAANTLGESRETNTLDFEHILWGLPWWIGMRLGAPFAWFLVVVGVTAITCYLVKEAKRERKA